MKTLYKTVLCGEFKTPYNSPDSVNEYRVLSHQDICCSKMQEAIDDDAIGFGGFRDDYLNHREPTINIASYAGYQTFNYHPISFCPFCGQPIEVEEKERVALKKKEHTRTITEVAYEEQEV